MPEKLTRRDFLRLGTLAAAGAVVSGCTINLQRTEELESYVEPPEEGLPGEHLWYATTCRACPAGCGTLVRVSDGRARKIEGNPLHPLNQGKLCARGQAALQDVYDPDRLKGAVRQTGGRGSRTFTPLPWEDALALLQERLRSAAPGAVAFLGGNPSTHVAGVVGRFMSALGGRAPVFHTFGDELEGRAVLAQSGAQLLGAAGLPLYDMANAEVVFSFGANFLETWLSPVYYSRAYAQMRRGPLGKRGYLVQFEPRLSSTAASADEWVPIRPGTEGLVAMALGKILLEQGEGNQVLGSPFLGVDVAEAAAASEVAAEDLERLARILATSPRSLVVPGGAVTGQHNGLSALAAVHALNGLLGRLGLTGGVLSAPGVLAPEYSPPPVSTFAEIEALIDAMSAGEVEVLLIHGANPLFELCTASAFALGLSQVPFVVSFGSTIDETSVQADLLLPDHTSLEAWGYHVPPLAGQTLVSAQQPVMRPLHDTRSTVDVLLAMAQALGGDLAAALPWPNEVDFLREAIAALDDGAGSVEAAWSRFRRQGGWWPERAAVPARPRPAGEAPVLGRAPVYEGDETQYPFHLHLFPSIGLFDGRGANKSWLQELPDPMSTVAWQTWVEIHPKTAQRLGLRDEDVVRVISPAGEIEAIVYVSPGILEQAVAIPVGRGHEEYGRYATWGHGSNPIQVLVPAVVKDSGALAWAATRVRIEPTGRRHSLARLEHPQGVRWMGLDYLNEE